MLLKSKEMAYLGVLLGLNQLFIILSSVIETNTVVLFAVAALIVGVVIVEFGGKSGAAFYLASCFLGFFLSFNKIEFITYIIFFGLYSLIKYMIEIKFINIKVQIIVKYVFFNVSLVMMFLVVKLFIALKLYWWMLVGAQLLFGVYDHAFTILINYYINTLKPRLKIK